MNHTFIIKLSRFFFFFFLLFDLKIDVVVLLLHFFPQT